MGDPPAVWRAHEAVVVVAADDEVVARLTSLSGIGRWSAEYVLLRDGLSSVKLPFPSRMSISGIITGQLVFTTESDWRDFRKGDLLAFDLAELKADPENAAAYLIYRPGPRDGPLDPPQDRRAVHRSKL